VSGTLADRIVLVTGASSGLGREVSRAFARQGARVALVARRDAPLERVRDEILTARGRAEIFPFDLTEIDAIPYLVEAVTRAMGGPVEILVNDAAIGAAGLVEDSPLAAYRRCLEVNFVAPLALIQAVLPGMRARGWGRIINVTSGAGRHALPGASAYSASKAALNALGESLRVEVAADGIAVVTFSPGAMATGFHERIPVHGRLAKKFPLRWTRRTDTVAERLVAACRRPRAEVIMWGPARLGLHLAYWQPRLLEWLIAREFARPAREERSA